MGTQTCQTSQELHGLGLIRLTHEIEYQVDKIILGEYIYIYIYSAAQVRPNPQIINYLQICDRSVFGH